MKNNFKLLYILSISLSLLACEAEQGPEGPTGPQGPSGQDGTDADLKKTGYFRGEVSGTRRDGTAFTEEFNYEYASIIDAFNGDELRIERFEKPLLERSASLALHLIIPDGENPEITPYFSEPVEFQLWREVDSETLFVLNAAPYFVAQDGYIAEISVTENQTYQFSTNSPDYSLVYYLGTYDGPTNPGTTAYSIGAYFDSNPIETYYSEATGELLGVYDYANQVYVETGAVIDLYNNLRFAIEPTLGIPVFYEVSSGNALYEEIPGIPADELNITNYVQDAETGIISFDFEIINGALYNSTNHPLTITGSFNSGQKVYNEVVFRTR